MRRGSTVRAKTLTIAALLVGCSSSQGTGAIREISVVSLNLRHDVDFWEERFDLIADEIVRLDPDVIGLQEIEIGAEQSEALTERIAARGGPEYEVFEVLKFGLQGLSGEGVGVFSRYPILESDSVDLGNGRPGVFVRLSVAPGVRVEIYDTHLHNEGGDAVRRPQMEAMIAFAAEHDQGAPRFFTGDMNADPESATIAAAIEGGWKDSFAEANPGAVGATSGIRLRKDDPTPQRAERRIDYVFYEPQEGVRVKSSTVTFDRPRADGLYPSDHLGVLSVFEITDPAP